MGGASPVALAIRNPPANAADLGLIPEAERSPEGDHGNPLQFSRLENPMDRAYSSWDRRESETTERQQQILLYAPWLLWTNRNCLSHRFEGSFLPVDPQKLLDPTGQVQRTASFNGWKGVTANSRPLSASAGSHVGAN